MTTSSSDMSELMNTNYTYPSPKKEDFQNEIYQKREFYYHKMPSRSAKTDYEDIKEYRDAICARKFSLLEHQSFLSNFINPDTPYTGLLVFHGTGTGKCLLPGTIVRINNKDVLIESLWDNIDINRILSDGEGEWYDVDYTTMTYKNGRFCNGRVIRIYREKIESLVVNVHLKNGRTLSMTQQHKIYIKEDNDFINFLKFSPDKKTVIGDNIEDEIEYISYEPYEGFVYDLEIENTHSYVANGILTHNTCAAIAIAEKFKDTVQKYNTKIYVLVSGPLIRESWKDQLLKCTGETYLKYTDGTVFIDEAEKNKMNRNAINQAMQYYRFMSYRSFYKKVLGEKIVERRTADDNTVKVSYRKTEEGEFERDIAVDRIYNLNNSIIIIDEAHGLTGNAYGEALMKIIKASTNLRVVLLTATPMKNLADDIVELLNFIRPQTSLIERDKIFTSEKNHEMQFKPGGLDYLKNMARGYVSYLRGADPLTFAKKVEKGEKPNNLLFTKIVRCEMLPFQRTTYDNAREEEDDSLDRKSEAVANFAIPGLSENKKSIVGLYGRHGLNVVRNQLKTYYDTINKKIATDILKDEDLETDSDLLYLSESGKTVTGSILKLNNLKHFSIKFYRALKKINRLFYGKKGARTAFVYSNLVKVGIELFTEVLLQNGYLEYQENPNNYTISANTICYFCGKTYKEHQTDKMDLERQGKIKAKKTKDDDNNSSSEYELKDTVPEHQFHPATFISVTGTSSEEGIDLVPEDKTRTLREVFNAIENMEGKHIKLVLGSKVMNEGISLMNVAEVHILDVYFNLGKVDQVIGRAIRHCSHYKMMNDKNPFPKVKVYKYAVTLGGKELSSEEELYRKAELKYLLVKKVERALKEVAIDCPLNRNGNIFPEEVAQHSSCCPLNREDTSIDYSKCLNKKTDDICPAICDFMSCEFKCEDATLNNRYYDPERKLYKKISKEDLDTSTFTNSLARNEIENTKKKIKEMYKIKYAYTLENIIEYVKNTYKGEKRDLFDEFFIFKALDELIPVTENDFNNFRDTILDKFNRQGYLIYVDRYYIFQPFDQNEDVPMYYRTVVSGPLTNRVTLYNYLKNKRDFANMDNKSTEVLEDEILKDATPVYDFDSTMEYYDSRDEYKYVGIVDKEASRRKTKHPDELNDVFKIREKRAKILEKKRGTGIPSLKGAVCATSKSKEYLEDIAKDLNIKIDDEETRTDLCARIKDILLEKEKYQVEIKGHKKMTYIMIPANHPKYPFPYNLEDRVEYRKRQIKEKVIGKVDINVKMSKKGDKVAYKMEIKNSDALEKESKFLASLGAVLHKDVWIIDIE